MILAEKATTSAGCDDAKESTITGEDAVSKHITIFTANVCIFVKVNVLLSETLFNRFLQVTADGELKPAVSFVVSFLRALSELKSPAAKRIISFLPHSLVRVDQFFSYFRVAAYIRFKKNGWMTQSM